MDSGVKVADLRKGIDTGSKALFCKHMAGFLRIIAEDPLEELFHGALRHVAKGRVKDEIVGFQKSLLGLAARARAVVQECRLETLPVAAHGVTAVHPRRDRAEGSEEIIHVRGEITTVDRFSSSRRGAACTESATAPAPG